MAVTMVGDCTTRLGNETKASAGEKKKRQVLKASSGSGRPAGHKLHPGNSEGPATSAPWERRHQTWGLGERWSFLAPDTELSPYM